MAGFTRGSHGNGAGPDRGERLPPGRYDVGSDVPVLTAEVIPCSTPIAGR